MVSRSVENLSNALEDIGKQLERTDLESMIQMEALDGLYPELNSLQLSESTGGSWCE